MRKILFLGNTNLVIFGLRGEIIEELRKRNYEVIVAFQSGPFGDGKENAEKYNCKHIEVEINRRGKNPLNDLVLLRKYIKIIKKEKPDVVLAFNVKCDIYGGIASRLLNVPFIPNITGLGKGLVEDTFTRKITTLLYKIAVKKAECVFFQNEDDKKFFEANKIKFKNGIVLPGSGVNIEKLLPSSYPKETNKMKFLYIARVMKAKGIDEYLNAAKIVKEKYENVEFQICGFCEEDYKKTLEEYEKKGIIKYFGLVDDIEKYIKDANCIVLPSYHPEGIANVLLESAAVARPIITTDRCGCRETVINNVSGFLIKEKNVEDLVEKIEKFLKLTNDEMAEMGNEGRKHIEKKFDRRIVVNEYLNEIEKIVKN